MRFTARAQRRAVLLLAAASLACAPAGREGESISVTDESAIIVWDATTKTQHFIRRASFSTEAKDFGFLVPTPSKPVLAEAHDSAFGFLARITAPETVWKWDTRKDVPKGEAPKAAAEKSEVKVLEEKKVAGFDAAVLEASDAAALDAWLKKHGYFSSPALTEWFKPYIADKWIITAFKISGDRNDRRRANSEAVKMSFTTDRPFFPYREPAAAATEKPDRYYPPRLLRVFFLSDGRSEGRIGAAGKWPGATVWSGTMDPKTGGELFKLLNLPDAAARTTLRLTEFEDRSDPRPGTDDLFFAPAADQSPVRRPPDIRWISFGDIVLWLIAGSIVAGIVAVPAYGLWRLVRWLRTP
jgi:hypothetical protein